MAIVQTPLEDELKVALEGERSRLQKSLDWLGEAEQALGSSVDATLEQAERWRLGEVEDALRRLAEGRFGSCESCQQPIDPARIIAFPWMRFCLSCAIRRQHANQPTTMPNST